MSEPIKTTTLRALANSGDAGAQAILDGAFVTLGEKYPDLYNNHHRSISNVWLVGLPVGTYRLVRVIEDE